MPRKAQVLAIVVVALFVGPLLGLSAAGNDVVVVTPETLVASDSPTGWYFWDDTNNAPGGPGALVDGPGTPPLGTGSVRLGPLTAASGADSRSAIATNAYYRELLSAFGELSYWTYTPTGANAITLQFDVSTVASAGAWCGRIIFEPANGNGAGAVVNDTWQEWDALAGNWWSTRNPANCTNWNAGVGSIADPQPWSWVLANFKQVEGRTLLKSGAGWLGFNGNADALTITTTNTTYDFELVAPSPPAPAPPAPAPPAPAPVAIQPRFTG